jgi:hypothetical protein
MPDRVHPLVKAVEPSLRSPLQGRVFGKAEVEELLHGHDTVLARRKVS